MSVLTGRFDEAEAYHETDFALWIEKSANQLRHGGEISKENRLLIAEEIDSLGGNHRNAIVSRCEILVMHLLKARFQPEKMSRSWLATIFWQRTEIKRLLETSPSLARTLEEKWLRIYRNAVRLAKSKLASPVFLQHPLSRLMKCLSTTRRDAGTHQPVHPYA